MVQLPAFGVGKDQVEPAQAGQEGGGVAPARNWTHAGQPAI